MYRLALRFLGHPEDAQDACQEILIRIVTHLGSFEGRSKFTTWAYTVATRSLLRTRSGSSSPRCRAPSSSRRSWTRAWATSTRHGGGRVPAALRGGPDQLHLRDAAVPPPAAAGRVPARRCHRAHRRRGRRDPRVQPRGVPAAGVAGPADAALRDRQPLRAGRSGQPVPLRPPDRRRRAGRHPAPRPPAARRAPARGAARLDRAGGQAARRRRGDRRPVPVRPFRRAGELWDDLQQRYPALLAAN